MGGVFPSLNYFFCKSNNSYRNATTAKTQDPHKLHVSLQGTHTHTQTQTQTHTKYPINSSAPFSTITKCSRNTTPKLFINNKINTNTIPKFNQKWNPTQTNTFSIHTHATRQLHDCHVHNICFYCHPASCPAPTT